MGSLAKLYVELAITIWAYMSFWFLVGLRLKRDDVVDSAWGTSFILIALVMLSATGNYSNIAVLAVFTVVAWGLRLFVHLTFRNARKKEDARYKELKTKWRNRPTLQIYLKIYLFQGLLVLLISTPLVAIIHSNNQAGHIVASAGFLIWFFGIFFEAIADHQLQNFVEYKQKGEVMQTGLWRYSRHPNYFGEICVWLGAALVAISLNQWWGLIGPLVIIFLLTRVSGIPLLEKRYKNNLDYQEYKTRTSVLIPWPPKES